MDAQDDSGTIIILESPRGYPKGKEVTQCLRLLETYEDKRVKIYWQSRGVTSSTVGYHVDRHPEDYWKVASAVQRAEGTPRSNDPMEFWHIELRRAGVDTGHNEATKAENGDGTAQAEMESHDGREGTVTQATTAASANIDSQPEQDKQLAKTT